MRAISLFLLAAVLSAPAAALFDNEEGLEKDEIITTVNSAGTTWKAGRNFHPSLKKSFLKYLVSSKTDRRSQKESMRRLVADDTLDLEALPKEFDARTQWSQCTAISHVPDQGPCNSAYVIVPTTVFQDRLCISTNGSFNSFLSVQQTLACCEYCFAVHGCSGGYVSYVWEYLINTGTCTGGPYKSAEGCQPYQIPKCHHDETSASNALKDCSSYGASGIVDTPKCKSTCYNKKYSPKFSDDIHMLNSSFSVEPKMKLIQKEIYQYGPLGAIMTIYEDFFSYKTGVYQYVTGERVGIIIVKILGWGVENGTKYWLAVNNWNEGWGDNGFFKIKRGVDECEFEDRVMGGYV